MTILVRFYFSKICNLTTPGSYSVVKESKLLCNNLPIFFVINNYYGIGNNAWKFQVSTMKIVSVARIWSLCVIRMMMTQRFCKGDNIW